MIEKSGLRARRRFVAAIVTGLVLVGLMATTAPPAAAAEPVIRVVGSSTTVRPNSPIPANASTSASVSAAGNEFESFQVIVQAPADRGLDDLRVDLGSSLAGPGGAMIPDANVTFYREHNYYASQRSDLEGAAGFWPDALIPERDYFYGENRAAFPVDVAAGEKLVAWIDILVPNAQTSGLYSGSIDVTSLEGGVRTSLGQVPVSVTVFGFSIPSTSSLATLFPIQNSAQPCAAHTGNGNCGGDAQMRWRLHSLYARAALENRFTISNPWPLGQDGPPPTGADLTRFNQYVLPLINGSSPQDAALSSLLKPVRLSGAKPTSLHVYGYRDWHCYGACLTAWRNFSEDPNGDGNKADSFRHLLTVYACDEPGQSAAVWNSCAPYGLSDSAGLPKLVTVAAQDAKAVGYLDEVDDLVPLVNYMVGKDCCGSRFVGNQRDHQDYTDFLSPAVYNTNATPPNRLWLYTSNMSHGSDDDSAAQLWEGWPGYAIDAPGLQARGMGWLSFAYRTTGELYYDTTTLLHTAWSNLYEAGGNGDGTLFYPGIPGGRGAPGDANYAPAIGGTNPIPVESIRMKRIREAREDYEYLKILEDGGQRAFGMEKFSQLFVNPNTGVFSMDTAMFSMGASSTTLTEATLEQAKRDLGAQIETLVGPVPEQPETTITSGPTGTVESPDASFTFISSKPDSTFECSLDGAPFTDCFSPATYTGLPVGAHNFAVRATDAAGTDPTPAVRTWTVSDPGSTPTTYRADGLIKASRTSAFKGNDIYNLTGKSQTWRTKARRGVTRSYVIRVQNDGEGVDSFSVVGSKVGRFTTRYFRGKTDVTQSVVAGMYSTGELAPGGTHNLKMVVKVGKRARLTAHYWRIHAVSYRATHENGENVRDVVRLKFTVTR